MPGVLRGADGPAGPSSGRVLPDADGGIPGGDRLRAGHRVAVRGLDLAAGVSGLRSGEDAAGAFHAVEDAQAAEPGGPRGGVRLGWVLERLRESGLLRGKTVGVDSTTLEANAAMRAIVRRDDGTEYDAWLEQLARASGIETPTRQDLAKLDRKRPKKGSNKDWKHPHDPEARITKMKDGRTRLAHKLEVGVDMETGAVAGVTVQTMDGGDTASLPVTLDETERQLAEVGAEPKEVVGDKGYHSNATMTGVKDRGLRSYVSEPNRGRRKWKGKREAQKAVYGNRRRIRGNRGKRLLLRRGEKLERTFAHLLVSGGLRRVHVRGQKGDPKTLAGSRRGLQPRADDARALRLRHPARPAGPRGSGPRRRLRTPLCDRCRPNRAHFRPPKPQHRLLPPFRPPLAQQDRAHSPPAVRTIGALADHFFHGLLGWKSAWWRPPRPSGVVAVRHPLTRSRASRPRVPGCSQETGRPEAWPSEHAAYELRRPPIARPFACRWGTPQTRACPARQIPFESG